MKVVYSTDDQEVIDKHQALIKERISELESFYTLFGIGDNSKVLDDPYLKLLQSDLNRFIMTRTNTRWIL